MVSSYTWVFMIDLEQLGNFFDEEDIIPYAGNQRKKGKIKVYVRKLFKLKNDGKKENLC